jgi:pyroglutamyl-peptidase
VTGAGHLLVTGFEPYGGERLNPSGEIARGLDGGRIAGLPVRGVALPVAHREAAAALGECLAAPGLVAAVHLGLAGGRARIAVECVAVNVMDYAIPDNRGERRAGEPCVPGGPAAYLATLPVRRIREALAAAGIPAYLSYTAGTYLCNYTLYASLHTIAARGLGVRAGFLHLPLLPAMVAAADQEQPSMDLALMRRAAELALGLAAG